MIYKVHGNLLDANTEALVNTVNTVGVMGRGIALQVSRAFPEVLPPYERACEEKRLKPGTVLTVDLNRLHGPRYIINVPTKRHWKGASKIEDIESGLAALAEEIVRLGLTSIAIPPLGCGPFAGGGRVRVRTGWGA
jgi:O-acetyl-ADP-ribose deacetylase (regulator of RNase III)